MPKLKTPWRDGTTHLVMSPLEFMQRLAALVPRPRLHLIRFHGVMAPNAKLRALVVPQGPDEGAKQAKPPQCETNCAHHRPVRLSWTRLLKRVFNLDLAHCANGGGELKIIAAILEQPVIEKILTHLGLQGPGAATGPRAWTGPAGRLSAVNHRRLSDLTPRVVGIACVQGFAGRSNAALLPGQACERALR